MVMNTWSSDAIGWIAIATGIVGLLGLVFSVFFLHCWSAFWHLQ